MRRIGRIVGGVIGTICAVSFGSRRVWEFRSGRRFAGDVATVAWEKGRTRERTWNAVSRLRAVIDMIGIGF